MSGRPGGLTSEVLDGLVGEVPGLQPLRVLTVLDQVVDGLGERLGEPAVLLRGRGDQALEGLAGTGERARDTGRVGCAAVWVLW